MIDIGVAIISCPHSRSPRAVFSMHTDDTQNIAVREEGITGIVDLGI